MQFAAPLILSVYISSFVYLNAFFVKKLLIVENADQMFFNQLGIFLIILVPVFFLLKKLVAPPQSGGAVAVLRGALLLVALLGLTVALLYHVIPLEGIYDLPAEIDKFFGSDTAFTIWLIIPLLALFM